MRDTDKKIIGIIPARNESEFLAKTLDGLKNQILPLTRIIWLMMDQLITLVIIAKKFDIEVLDLKNRGIEQQENLF